MIIQKSTLTLKSSHTYEERYQRSERLRYWNHGRRAENDSEEVKVILSPEAQDMLEKMRGQANKEQARGEIGKFRVQEGDEIIYQISEKDKQKVQLLQKMLEVLTGKKIKGAIYLGHIETLFDIKNAANETTGRVKNTGLWLNEENGTPGTVQQIDLKIE